MEPIRIARQLRRESTDAERKLWSRLRSRQLGYKFRRQMPVGRFIADFACIEAKLVIEVDGGQHNMYVHLMRDQERTATIEAAGYLVMRFWNNEVLRDIDEVVERIAETLATRAGVDD